MKYLLYLIIPIAFLSCTNDDENEDYLTNTILKRTDIDYTQYGNLKQVTYYQNDKPTIDSTFYYSDDSYPETFLFKRDWQYNNNKLVQKITSTSPDNQETFTEITYDSQERISLINYNNSYHSSFVYNGLQITKNSLSIQEGTNYTYQYEIDQNHNIVSETNPNEVQIALVQYSNNNIVQHTSPQLSNLHFSYLDNTIPTFMKHLEFGENLTNYVLYTGSLNYNNLLNIGSNFIDQIGQDNINWTNIDYEYEFNDELLPVYIKSKNNDYLIHETFFEYQ